MIPFSTTPQKEKRGLFSRIKGAFDDEKKQLKQLEKIAAPIEEQGGRVVVAHRTGELTLTDIAVFVGVAAPHRAEAFKWCQHVIDTLKHEVPIWKKEYDTDKVRWGN